MKEKKKLLKKEKERDKKIKKNAEKKERKKVLYECFNTIRN